ncbi:hypothetical protein C8A05DRAFT_38008 [Staphylotrichum tortipilum]|uniref:Protein kinase domain-containing protein n=1 Tax=Staphylotrichum tortipilum TaxID=2831512 RepID=A0AAN6MCT8_9PEZI|nr:hypothetical protein C8A05DRAFT_38008 [Staphylotrichum longicolle]
MTETLLGAEATALAGEAEANFLRFLRRMLQWDPRERPSAQELLKDPWLVLTEVQGARANAKAALKTTEQIKAEKRARKAAKREVKKTKVDEAEKAGYEKRDWSVSMLVLYDDYHDKGAALHTAQAAYWTFRNSFRNDDRLMTYDDHIEAARLAREWESAA